MLANVASVSGGNWIAEFAADQGFHRSAEFESSIAWSETRSATESERRSRAISPDGPYSPSPSPRPSSSSSPEPSCASAGPGANSAIANKRPSKANVKSRRVRGGYRTTSRSLLDQRLDPLPAQNQDHVKSQSGQPEMTVVTSTTGVEAAGREPILTTT